MISIVLCSTLAFAFWFAMFGPWTSGKINFWLAMPIACLVLGTIALYSQRKNLTHMFAFKFSYIPLGIIFAAVLYMLFYIGNTVSGLILPFAQNQVDGIYHLAQNINKFYVGLLLFFIIGPCEEIFWRGFIQDRLSFRYGKLAGLIVGVIIYSLVHIWSFNFMLIAAAGLCGLIWGWLYYKFNNLWVGIISHALWDIAIFLIWPLS